ncbi:MAG: Cobalamin-binding protein precursor [Methanosaeta sp. PtaU1.Bin112]|nr:MAG: Cobalamin-binding protein precursor [Methanosaeta sp. PtaU1.Bin112]
MKFSAVFLALFLAGTSVASGASDYVLGIFGNANMDGTIDEADAAYIKEIIDAKANTTELADANHDGMVDSKDIDQVKMIINGIEEELTVLMDVRTSMGSTEISKTPVTIPIPVNRIVVTSPYSLSILRSLKVETDRIVGIPLISKEATDYFPEFGQIDSIGGSNNVDYEKILSLNPDLVIVFTSGLKDASEKLPGVTIATFDFWRPSSYVDETRRLGYILGKNEEAEEFISFYSGVMDSISKKVDAIALDKKPKIYFESEQPYATSGNGSGWNEKATLAGGNNIFGDLPGYPTVDAETVMTKNPEFIVKQPKSGPVTSAAYLLGTNETALSQARDEIMLRPELSQVDAVKKSNVYILYGDIIGATRHFVGIAYMAKWFYPDLFKDLDPKGIHQRYLTEFQGLPSDFLEKHGEFAYPEAA